MAFLFFITQQNHQFRFFCIVSPICMNYRKQKHPNLAEIQLQEWGSYCCLTPQNEGTVPDSSLLPVILFLMCQFQLGCDVQLVQKHESRCCCKAGVPSSAGHRLVLAHGLLRNQSSQQVGEQRASWRSLSSVFTAGPHRLHYCLSSTSRRAAVTSDSHRSENLPVNCVHGVDGVLRILMTIILEASPLPPPSSGKLSPRTGPCATKFGNCCCKDLLQIGLKPITRLGMGNYPVTWMA